MTALLVILIFSKCCPVLTATPSLIIHSPLTSFVVAFLYLTSRPSGNRNVHRVGAVCAAVSLPSFPSQKCVAEEGFAPGCPYNSRFNRITYISLLKLSKNEVNSSNNFLKLCHDALNEVTDLALRANTTRKHEIWSAPLQDAEGLKHRILNKAQAVSATISHQSIGIHQSIDIATHNNKPPEILLNNVAIRDAEYRQPLPLGMKSKDLEGNLVTSEFGDLGLIFRGFRIPEAHGNFFSWTSTVLAPRTHNF